MSASITTTNHIVEFEIEDIGWDHPDYFPGCGLAFTPWEHCAVGVGECPAAALGDALDNMAHTVSDSDLVKIEASAEAKKLVLDERTYDEMNPSVDDAEDFPLYYVCIYWRLA